MIKPSSALINYDTGSGYPDGKYKDNPGDATGSEQIAITPNDAYYALSAIPRKYLPSGAVSDTAETSTASDLLDGFEYAAGYKEYGVSTYSATTTYAKFAHVMYLGFSFISKENSNYGNNPIANPDKWFMVPYSKQMMLAFALQGEIFDTGVDDMHNPRSADYLQYFEMGTYNFGGYSGRNFKFYGVHVDETQITGDATLVSIFDVGGADEYIKLDLFAPDSGGIRTLKDYRGTYPRASDGTGGETEDVGARGEDAGQTITGEFQFASFNANTISLYRGSSGAFGKYSGGSFGYTFTRATDTQAYDYLTFNSANSTSPNPSKTSDTETKVKASTRGVPFIIVPVEV